MDISFGSQKLQRQCAEERAMRDAWGPAVARKLMLRLTEMEAAETLDDLRRLPQARCQGHPTDKGLLSVALSGPQRLVFEADYDPLPLAKGGGLDWGRVKKVRVLRVSATATVFSNERGGDFEEAIRA